MTTKGTVIDKWVALLQELNEGPPATLYELSAVTGYSKDHTREHIKRLHEAGLVEFRGFDTSKRRRGQYPGLWAWRRPK